MYQRLLPGSPTCPNLLRLPEVLLGKLLQSVLGLLARLAAGRGGVRPGLQLRGLLRQQLQHLVGRPARQCDELMKF